MVDENLKDNLSSEVLEEKLVQVNRVAKVVKGGRIFGFTAVTVVGDGTQRRDFTHISDIVRGLICLTEGNHSGEVFSLGTGQNHSLFEVAYAFDDNIRFIPPRPGEAAETLADISAMINSTSWSPQVKLMEYIDEFKKTNLNK